MERLGKYINLEHVGRGASATVYKAYHPRLQVYRALKVFDNAAESEGLRRQEAFYQARIEHEGIVRVLDFEEDEGLLFMVMEFAPLGTLRDHLQNGPLELNFALSLARQICQALSAAHDGAVWHLDLKPENILFFTPNTIKIADFGLAQAPNEAIGAELLRGTPAYMAPEQIKGMPSAQSDLWALGTIIFEMLSGEVCFPGESFTQVNEAITNQADHTTARLKQTTTAASYPRLIEIVAKLLAINPRKRYQSPAELYEYLSLLSQQDKSEPSREQVTVEFSNFCGKCKLPIPSDQEICPGCADREISIDYQAIEAPPESSAEKGRLGVALQRRWLAPFIGAGLALLAFAVWNPYGSIQRPIEVPDQAASEHAAATDPLPVSQIGGIAAQETPVPKASATEPREKQVKATPKPPGGTLKEQESDKAKVADVTIKLPERREIKPPSFPNMETPAQKPISTKTNSKNYATDLSPKKSSRPKPGSGAAETIKAEGRPVLTSQLARDTAVRDKVKTGISFTQTVKTPAKPAQGISMGELTDRQSESLGTRRNRALAHMQAGEYKQASAILKGILKANPHDVEAKNTLELIQNLESGG